MTLDPQSTRRFAQLVTLLRQEVERAGPDAEVVLRVRTRGGRIARDSRIVRTVETRLDEGASLLDADRVESGV